MKVKDPSRYRSVKHGLLNSPYSADLINECFIHSAGVSKQFVIRVKPNLIAGMKKVTKTSHKKAKKLSRYYFWSIK